VASAAEGAELARELSYGNGADVVIETVGVLDSATSRAAFDAVGKGGRLVLTGTADDPQDVNFQIPANQLTFKKITVRGDLLGGCNAPYDIPRLARLYDEGHLKVRELITKTYGVEEVAAAYADVRDGRIMRGVLGHQHGS
jgi:Zn-dependent alcohol dehydrogenase